MKDFLMALGDISYVPTVLIRIVLAVLAGAAIGFERGKHGRAAGLRTHILISLGSAMASMVGIFMTSAAVSGDPSRIASGVVSGIGFLCAGIILVKNSSKVTGLTTAAAMWATATIGLAFGAGFYIGALVGTLLLFLTLTIMTVFESRQKKDRRFFLEIDGAEHANAVVKAIAAHFPISHSFDILPAKSGLTSHIGLAVNIMDTENAATVVDALCTLEFVVFAIEE